MMMENDLQHWLHSEDNEFLPHISLDCVIFGFHGGKLKVLLLKMKNQERNALPGGFLMKHETLEEAAIRTLKERTGLENIFLQQFHVFSDPARSDPENRAEELKKMGFHPAKAAWFGQRFLSVGFYALVEFSLVAPQPDSISDSCSWHNLAERGQMVLDHGQILDSALNALACATELSAHRV